MLASICIVGALIMALFPAGVVGAGFSESGFHISQWTGETWEEIYQHQFQVQYSTEAFTVDVVDGKVVLRIVQVGTPFADVDQISLMVDGEELTPEYARYTGSGKSVLEDILELDHNVVIAHEQEIEVSWDVPAGYGSVTVYLTANEYGHGLPFRFPEIGYATYEMRSNAGSITVDGLITETDGTLPLYCPYWQPSSGHPDGYTYIYVCDDEQYVYFSLDITMDNTNEYGEDWAEIRMLQPDGSEQAFRIDDFDDTWGESGFGLTSKVSYKHQTCEFAIPKSIIDDNDIKFSLVYYGTGSIGGYVWADADVDPLVIEINGDSSSGQVFNVGDTINVEGFVHSVANASVGVGGYLLETELSCDLWLNPGNLEHDWDYEENSATSSGNYTEIVSEYNGSLWFTHTLTTPGVYNITLDSTALASVSYSGGSVLGSDDDAHEWLSFTVVTAGPSNDNFADATVITGASGSTNGTNWNATIEDGEPFHSQWSGGTCTVWWSWTAPTTGTAAFNTLGSNFDTVMAAYTGDNVSSLTLLSESDDAYFTGLLSRIVFKVTAATTYHIAVAGYYEYGIGDITLNWGYATAPANDDFPGITISGTTGSSVFSSVNATREVGEPMHLPTDSDYAGKSSLWWSWTAPSSGNVTFDTNGSVREVITIPPDNPPDLVLAIYTGASLGGLTLIDSSYVWSDDELVIPAVGGTTYKIAIDGWDASYGSKGSIHLNWSYQPPIFTSATGTAFAVGTAGLFDITTTADPVASSISIISGTLPTGVNFNNEGDGTATLSGTPAAGTGNLYSLTFSANNTLATGTQNFTLTVNEAPAFVSASSTNFTVGAYGVFNLATTGYPWVTSISLTSGSLPSGITYSSSTMTLSGTPAAGTGGTYPLTFSASNGISPDASQNFTLTVNQAPIFTSADSDTFSLNSTGSFTVTASGYPTPSIHLTSGTPPSGVAYNSSTGVLSGTPTEGGTFALTFTASNGVSPNATQNFTVNVNAAPNITTPPQNVVVEEGQNASFTVIYSAYPAPTFQWQISRNGGGRWSNIRGANSATYNISATTSRMSGNMYQVIVSNDLGTATSDPATLTVMPGAYTTADVSIDKSDGVYNSVNGTISWNITVVNSGPDMAEGVTVVDNLARGTRFSSITGISETQVKVKGSSVTVTTGSLDNGTSVNFTIVALVTRATSPVDNSATATVGTTIYDPDLSNNTDSAECSW